MKSVQTLATVVITLCGMTNSATAFASPFGFDCDVPPDHYSSVSQDLTGSPTLGGTIEAVQLRSGKSPPVVGARLASADGANGIALQLVAETAGAKQFAIVLNVKRGKTVQRSTLGQVATSAAIRFSLSIAANGKATLLINGNKFDADFIPIRASKAMVFCSTGQFKISDLRFMDRD